MKDIENLINPENFADILISFIKTKNCKKLKHLRRYEYLGKSFSRFCVYNDHYRSFEFRINTNEILPCSGLAILLQPRNMYIPT